MSRGSGPIAASSRCGKRSAAASIRQEKAMVDLALRAQAEGESLGQRWFFDKLRALPKRLGIPFWTTLVLLGAWWAAAQFQWVKPLFLPSPLDVAAQFYNVAVEGFSNATLLQHI